MKGVFFLNNKKNPAGISSERRPRDERERGGGVTLGENGRSHEYDSDQVLFDRGALRGCVFPGSALADVPLLCAEKAQRTRSAWLRSRKTDSCARYGTVVPDKDLIVEISELLIAPFAVTSLRKFDASAS